MNTNQFSKQEIQSMLDSLYSLSSKGMDGDELNIIVAGLRVLLSTVDRQPAAWLRNPNQGFHLPMIRLGPEDPNPNSHYEEFYPVFAAPQLNNTYLDSNHIKSKNAIDAIITFIDSDRNPTRNEFTEITYRPGADESLSCSEHVIEYIMKISSELIILRNKEAVKPSGRLIDIRFNR